MMPALLLAIAIFLAAAETATAQSVRPPANAVNQAAPPTDVPAAQPLDPPAASRAGGNYDVELWQKLRQGARGTVSIPDRKAGILVQADGTEWSELRRNALPRWGGYALAAMLAALAAFYAGRGRIRIESGPSGATITRFTSLERTAHWLMAMAFLLQAATGLMALYGRDLLIPLLGKQAFASLASTAKLMHAYVAFAFMAGLLLSFVLWVRHNFPAPRDVVWLLKAGGLFSKHSHPPAHKFNAGQKILFWMIMLGGVALSLTGLSLLLPFEISLFEKTFHALNAIGFSLPTSLSPVQEMQYAVTWHSVIALGLLCVIIAHIYIGTIGMEGAFDAMGSGKVDVNWAKEHHSLWVADEVAKDRIPPPGATGRIQPAE